MKVNFFHRGEWSCREVADWPSDNGFEDWLRLLGFETYSYLSLGEEFEVYEAADAEPKTGAALFIVLHHFVALDEVDYVDLRARWAPAFTASAIHSELEDINRALSRIFRVWHGHDPEWPCMHCGTTEEKERIERRRLKKA